MKNNLLLLLSTWLFVLGGHAFGAPEPLTLKLWPGGPPSRTSFPSGIRPGQIQISFSGSRSLARWLISRRFSFGGDETEAKSIGVIGITMFAE